MNSFCKDFWVLWYIFIYFSSLRTLHHQNGENMYFLTFQAYEKQSFHNVSDPFVTAHRQHKSGNRFVKSLY